MIVHKFGGTSVGNAVRFSSVAETIITQQARNSPVVVVSAMSGVTNALIAGARAAAEGKDAIYREIRVDLLRKHLDVVSELLGHSPERLDVGGLIEDRLHDLERLYRSIAVLGELTVRGCDAVVSLGERLSSHILAAVLRERGARAQAISATELIVTDDTFGAAMPRMDLTRRRLQERLLPMVERGVIPVVTGYIGATESGVTTTLGRGGSDYTAAIVGAGLNADEVWVWSDVNGILTADPNIVPQARTICELSYAEAAELAYYGADVLHPKTIRPVTENGIPLRILNSYEPDQPGTLIVESPRADRERLPAIISTTGLALIAVGSADDSWDLHMAARVLQKLCDAGIDVLMFSQSFSEHSLNLVVREQDHAHCIRIVCREFGGVELEVEPSGALSARLPDGGTTVRLGDACNLGTREKVATVSVVGVPGWRDAGIVSHAFAALGRYGTRVIAVAQAASEYSVSFCIPEDQVGETVRFLHRELGLESEQKK